MENNKKNRTYSTSDRRLNKNSGGSKSGGYAKGNPSGKRASNSQKVAKFAKSTKSNASPNLNPLSRISKKGIKKGSKELKLIPLGGLNEIGKNMMALEYGDDIMIIDCGMSFPDDEMFGIDVVIPDFSYVIENQKKLKGIVITHGHEDHIGAVPYLLKYVNAPVYAMEFPLGLIANKLKEHGLQGRLSKIKTGDKFKLGCFEIEAIRITHSIVDSICLSVDTPVGRIFHTGDFKIDYTPVDGEPIDFARLAAIGAEGVDLLMADSTNAIRPGFTASERVVGKALENIIRDSDSRIIIATFSSNVHRIQKIIDNAVFHGRKVAMSGRSLVNNAGLAKELGYLKIPANILVDINKIKGIPDNKLVILTTGSQGEPMSALARMAAAEHKAVQIKKGDTVVLSSTPVPGNEKTVSNVVNRLLARGAEVIYSDIADIHVSGHACEEELKLMQALIHPKYFMPVHGEYRHLEAHAGIAQQIGLPAKNTFILANGDMLLLGKSGVRVERECVPAEPVLVDGLGIGDVGSIVLKDRKLLSESGLIIVVVGIDGDTHEIVAGPDIVSRGFVYVRENEDLISDARRNVEKTLDSLVREDITDWNVMKSAVRQNLKNFIYAQTKREPIILPIFLEV